MELKFKVQTLLQNGVEKNTEYVLTFDSRYSETKEVGEFIMNMLMAVQRARTARDEKVVMPLT